MTKNFFKIIFLWILLVQLEINAVAFELISTISQEANNIKVEVANGDFYDLHLEFGTLAGINLKKMQRQEKKWHTVIPDFVLQEFTYRFVILDKNQHFWRTQWYSRKLEEPTGKNSKFDLQNNDTNLLQAKLIQIKSQLAALERTTILELTNKRKAEEKRANEILKIKNKELSELQQNITKKINELEVVYSRDDKHTKIKQLREEIHAESEALWR